MRPSRELRLVQSVVDGHRLPAGKRSALLRFPIPATVQHVDRHPRRPPPRTAPRPSPRHLHPYLRKAPRLVHPQLPAPNVRGEIDLQDHVRKVVLPDHDAAVLRQPGLPRIQVHALVGLEDLLPFAVFVPQFQVRRPVAPDARPARQRDVGAQLHDPLRRLLMADADGFAHPGRLGVAIPILQPPLPGVEVAARERDRPAAGKVGLGRRRIRRPDRRLPARLRRPRLRRAGGLRLNRLL